jgi:hypothetical protein
MEAYRRRWKGADPRSRPARIYDRSRTLGFRETAATQVRAGPCTAKIPEVMPGELNVHDSVIAERSAPWPTKFDQKEIRWGFGSPRMHYEEGDKAAQSAPVLRRPQPCPGSG